VNNTKPIAFILCIQLGMLNFCDLTFAKQAVDVGLISIESSIRFPETQVIESNEFLESVTAEILSREFESMEEEILNQCQGN
jgi:hypothetical protein